jgi:hypothetical protein
MEVRSVDAIVSALTSAKVEYLIVGGLAVIAHGYERLTKDVDLVIRLEPANIRNGLQALIAIGYRMSIPVTPDEFANAENRERWRREKEMVVLKLWSDEHRRTPIDIFVFEPFDFTTELRAARWFQLGTQRIPVLSLDSLIAMKQDAGRPQDLADVAALQEIRQLSAGDQQL